jgi:hypothetical protein
MYPKTKKKPKQTFPIQYNKNNNYLIMITNNSGNGVIDHNVT